MIRSKQQQHEPARSRGAAMTETILVLPFIVFVLSLIFFFGRGIVRNQRAAMMPRYEAWRQAGGEAPGPRSDETNDQTLLNKTFFANRPATIDYHATNHFPEEATDDLIDAASQYSPQTGQLAQDLIDLWPRGRTVDTVVEYDETIRVWQDLNGAIHRRYTRLDNDWRFANHWELVKGQWRPDSRSDASVLETSRDAFLHDFDRSMKSLDEDQRNDLARAIRDLYLNEPYYIGPNIDQ